MDNVDNLTQTHRPRADVSTPETAVFKAKSPFYAAGGQSLNTARPNMDNVDNRTQTRPPLCVRIRPVVCVVSTTGQKPETDERRAFSFGRVLAVFVKCRNTNIYPLFRLYFGYISAIFSRFLAVFWPFSGKGRTAALRLYHTRRQIWTTWTIWTTHERNAPTCGGFAVY